MDIAVYYNVKQIKDFSFLGNKEDISKAHPQHPSVWIRP